MNLLPPESPVTPGKRKAAGTKETPPAKKAKADGEGEEAQTILEILFIIFYFNVTRRLNLHVIKQYMLCRFYSSMKLYLCFCFSGFCLFVGNLNANKDFDELKEALKKFFTKNNVEVSEVRLGGSK